MGASSSTKPPPNFRNFQNRTATNFRNFQHSYSDSRQNIHAPRLPWPSPVTLSPMLRPVTPRDSCEFLEKFAKTEDVRKSLKDGLPVSLSNFSNFGDFGVYGSQFSFFLPIVVELIFSRMGATTGSPLSCPAAPQTPVAQKKARKRSKNSKNAALLRPNLSRSQDCWESTNPTPAWNINSNSGKVVPNLPRPPTRRPSATPRRSSRRYGQITASWPGRRNVKSKLR